MFLTVGLPCIRTYRSFNKDKVLKLCFLPWACLAHYGGGKEKKGEKKDVISTFFFLDLTSICNIYCTH